MRALATAAGEALFGDARVYGERPAFTTRPLESLLASASLPAPITRMRVIACTRERFGEGRVRADGPRAHALASESPGLAGGYLPEATLRFDLAGEDTPVDVDVRLPSRFWCSAPEHAPLVRGAMESLGMMSPGAGSDDAWTLFPVKHGAWRLHETLGEAAVRELVAAKALRRSVSRNVTSQELRAHGTNYVTFPVPGEPGVHYALASDPSVPARDVTEEDREVLELDPKRLAALRGEQLRLSGKTRVTADGAVATLGTLMAPSTRLVFTALLRAPSSEAERASLVRDLRDAALPGHAVLLLPRGRAWGSGLFEVEFDGLIAGGAALTRAAVTMARVEDEVDLSLLADAPLVLHRATRRAWLLRTPLALPDSGWAMLEGLALRGGEVATAREVCKWISPARASQGDIAPAKATRLKLVRWITESFAAAGTKAPRAVIDRVVIAQGRRGYRVGVAADVS